MSEEDVDVVDSVGDGAEGLADDNSGDHKPESDDAEGTEASGGEPEPEKKNHQQRRWDKLLSENGRLAGELAELRRQKAEEKVETVQQEDEATPTRDQFVTDEDYVDALTTHKVNLKASVLAAEIAQKAEAAAAQKAFLMQKAELRKATKDYDEAISASANLPVTPVVENAILTSDKGAAIQYHLAKNPDEAIALSQMNNVAAIKYIGRLEATLEASPKKKVTAAKDPINSLGTGRGNAPVDEDKLSDAQYFAKERVKQRAKYGK